MSNPQDIEARYEANLKRQHTEAPAAQDEREALAERVLRVLDDADYPREDLSLDDVRLLALLAACATQAAAEGQVLTTCNCRWHGEKLVQQCTLHEAWRDAIHDWAERAKGAETKLAGIISQAAPAPQPTAQAEAATVLREALDMLGEQELKDVFGYEWFGRARHAAARPSGESKQ